MSLLLSFDMRSKTKLIDAIVFEPKDQIVLLIKKPFSWIGMSFSVKGCKMPALSRRPVSLRIPVKMNTDSGGT